MHRYKIADVVFDLQTIYGYTVKLCENYAYTGNEPPAFTAVMTKEDIDAETDYLATLKDEIFQRIENIEDFDLYWEESE